MNTSIELLREAAGGDSALLGKLMEIQRALQVEHEALESELDAGDISAHQFAASINERLEHWIIEVSKLIGPSKTEAIFGVEPGEQICLLDPEAMEAAERDVLAKFDISKFRRMAQLEDRYSRQLERLRGKHLATGAIESTVNSVLENISDGGAQALVIYGEPQSGKTEMMICLTGLLLDNGHPVVVHLMNDSVDLLSQNLRRFKQSGLAPAARTLGELPAAPADLPAEVVVFCKKNARDLEKLITRLREAGVGRRVVIDDEADYATPNSRVNQGKITRINELVGALLGDDGIYIGVTATPARLDLNNTFENATEKWVRFSPHQHYTGQDTFFPLERDSIDYRRVLLRGSGDVGDARAALVRFLVTAAYLNTYEYSPERNWTMLVHTSGRKVDHRADQDAVQRAVAALVDGASEDFAQLAAQVFTTANRLYPRADADAIVAYVVRNASRVSLIVLNSERDRKAAGDNATDPLSPFTIIIGGNIVSRGVTFPNLLSMFFTRDVKHKLQQDTYIQRARMFGARGEYLEHFELTIPDSLYSDWWTCFVFHRLALETISSDLGAPVWIGSNRISVAANPSIDRTTVVLDKGEMSFQMFDFSPDLDEVVRRGGASDPRTLTMLQEQIGTRALPQFLIRYISTIAAGPGSLAIHLSSSIEGYKGQDVDQELISRRRGFIGAPQLERKRFPSAVHHIKIFHNGKGRARVFYKFSGGLQFVQSRR